MSTVPVSGGRSATLCGCRRYPDTANWWSLRVRCRRAACSGPSLGCRSSSRVPREWIEEQARLARLPGFLVAALKTLRSQANFGRQREVLRERVFPLSQARPLAARLWKGSLEIIPDRGHLPQVERPDPFVVALSRAASGRAANGRCSHDQPLAGPSTVPYDLLLRRARRPRAAACGGAQLRCRLRLQPFVEASLVCLAAEAILARASARRGGPRRPRASTRWPSGV